MLFISLLGSLQLAIFRNGIAENSVALNQSDAMEVFSHYMYILEPFERPQLPLMVMEHSLKV